PRNRRGRSVGAATRAARRRHRAVRDDEDLVVDPGASRRFRKLLLGRQRMPVTGPWRRREVLLDVYERSARDVPLEVELASASRRAKLPAAIDELVLHADSPTTRRTVVTTSSTGIVVSISAVAARRRSGSTFSTSWRKRRSSSGSCPYELFVLLARASISVSSGAGRSTR